MKRNELVESSILSLLGKGLGNGVKSGGTGERSGPETRSSSGLKEGLSRGAEKEAVCRGKNAQKEKRRKGETA